MSGLRWIALAGLAFFLLVAYAIGVGVAWWALQPPAPMTPEDALEPVPPALVRALTLASLNGIFLGLLLGPVMALWVVRRTNDSMSNPAQQAVWWGRGNLVLMRMFLFIPLAGAIVGGALAWQGDGGQGPAFARGLVYGSFAGAAGVALRSLAGVLIQPR